MEMLCVWHTGRNLLAVAWSSSKFSIVRRDAMKHPTAYIFDFDLFHDAQEELQMLKDEMERVGLLEHLDIQTSNELELIDESKHFDLVILDLGGMSMSGGSGFVESMARMVRNWLDFHPGTLLLIWTYFTRDVYESASGDVLGEDTARLRNVAVRFNTHNEEIEWAGIVKQWLGIQ